MEDGTDCYCGAAGDSYDKNGALGEESCGTLCDSNPDSACGGLGAIEVRKMGQSLVRRRSLGSLWLAVTQARFIVRCTEIGDARKVYVSVRFRWWLRTGKLAPKGWLPAGGMSSPSKKKGPLFYRREDAKQRPHFAVR